MQLSDVPPVSPSFCLHECKEDWTEVQTHARHAVLGESVDLTWQWTASASVAALSGCKVNRAARRDCCVARSMLIVIPSALDSQIKIIGAF